MTRKTGMLDMFNELGFKVGVEVGTDHGEYAKVILDRMPNVKLYTIDPFLAYTEGQDVKTQEDVDKIYEQAKELLKGYPNCTMVREKSLDAVKRFSPETIDFVFIDGDHTYEEVKKDLNAWAKIVKKGGIVAGHDYREDKARNYGVVEAVNEYVLENNQELYILRKGTYVDCFMFIND